MNWHFFHRLTSRPAQARAAASDDARRKLEEAIGNEDELKEALGKVEDKVASLASDLARSMEDLVSSQEALRSCEEKLRSSEEKLQTSEEKLHEATQVAQADRRIEPHAHAEHAVQTERAEQAQQAKAFKALPKALQELLASDGKVSSAEWEGKLRAGEEALSKAEEELRRCTSELQVHPER